LGGPRQELDVVEEVVGAAMVDRLAGPGSQKDLKRLVEHLAPQSIIDLLSRPRKLAGELVSPETHSENEAAAAPPIQRCGFPRNLGWATARKRGDHWTQRYRLGSGCDGRQGDPRISHLCYWLPPGDLIPHEDPMPTSLLRLGSETCNYTRFGKVLEEGQPQTRAHDATKVA
jgi:hypothetical protein